MDPPELNSFNSSLIKVEQMDSDMEEPCPYSLTESEQQKTDYNKQVSLPGSEERVEAILPNDEVQQTMTSDSTTPITSFYCIQCRSSFPTLLSLKCHEMGGHSSTEKTAISLMLTQTHQVLQRAKFQPKFKCRFLGCSEEFSSTSLRVAHENKLHRQSNITTKTKPAAAKAMSKPATNTNLQLEQKPGNSSSQSPPIIRMPKTLRVNLGERVSLAQPKVGRQTRNRSHNLDDTTTTTSTYELDIKPTAEELRNSKQAFSMDYEPNDVSESRHFLVPSTTAAVPSRWYDRAPRRKRVTYYSNSDEETEPKKKMKLDESANVEETKISTPRKRKAKAAVKPKPTPKPPKVYNCDECEETFKQKRQLAVHKNKHAKVVKEYSCPVCELKFPSAKKRRRHQLAEGHLVVEEPSADDLVCPFCDKTFKGDKALKQHTLIHTGGLRFQCTVCDKRFRQGNDLVAHSRVHTNERPYLCKVCGLRFKTSSTYSHHAVTHSEEKRFKCTSCPKSFHRASDLRIHNLKHTGEKPFICEACGKSFAQRRSMKRHYCPNSVPTQVSCKLCGRSLKTQAKLDSHIAEVHGEERPFQCGSCDKAFVTQARLDLHSKSHDPNLKRKEHNCETCGRRFACLKYIVLHKCVPRPHKCPSCPKAYETREQMEGHLRIHDPGNKFVCEVCQKEFPNGFVLRTHSVTHLKDKIFSCETCGKGFASSLQFSKHQKLHEMDRVSCQICSKSFAHITSLKYHLMSFHGQPEDNQFLQGDIGVPSYD